MKLFNKHIPKKTGEKMHNVVKRSLPAVMSLALLAGEVTLVLAMENPSEKEAVIYINLTADGFVKEIYAVNIFQGGDITNYGEYSVDEVSGKSEKLEIKFKVTKNEAYEGDFFDTYALQAAFALDTKKCSNIKAEDATLANVGSKKQISYTMLPGEGIDTTITADVTDFEMDAGINAYTGGVAEIVSGYSQIVNGTGALLTGSSQLQSGTAELYSKMGELLNGIVEFYEGTDTLKEGTDELAPVAVVKWFPLSAKRTRMWMLYSLLSKQKG